MQKDVFITTDPEIFFYNHELTTLERIYLELIELNGFLEYQPITNDKNQILQTTANIQETILIIFQKIGTLEQLLGQILNHPEQEILKINDRIEVVYSNGQLQCYNLKNNSPWNPPQTLDNIFATLYPIIHPRQQRNLKRPK